MSKTTLTIKELLVKEFKIVGPQTTVAQARKITHFNKRVLLISMADRLLGIVSSCQLNQKQLSAETELKSIMLTNFVIVDESHLHQDITEFFPDILNQSLVVYNKDQKIHGVITPDLLMYDLIINVKHRNSQINTILDSVVEAICIINHEDRVIAWNKRAEKLYGIKADKITGEKIDKYFSNLLITKVIKQRKEIRSSYHQPCPGTHVLLSALPVKYNEQIIGAISAERDITEIVELNQELTKANSQVRKLEKEINDISKHYNPFAVIKGHHKDILSLLDLAYKVAPTDADILIQGESGTGKELLARSIHQASPRAKEAFIIVSCDAIPPENFMQELFGPSEIKENTSDQQIKSGLLIQAQNGTVFFNEIGAMPPDVQAKLVQVLEGGTHFPHVTANPLRANIRVIASTQHNPEELLRQKIIREDLFYRLSVVTLKPPPLRERREDIPELAYFYLEEFCQLYQKKITRIEPTVTAALLAYSWPGNITELKNVIQRMVILTESEVIDEKVLPTTIKQINKSSTQKVSLATAVQQAERNLIVDTLKQTNGNRSKAAKLLKIPRSTLYYKMHQLGLL
ncbi:sigma 54-interacting transcriptional regulator [Desulfolucanica intricata]|uniref:sigma 54-interacting transcriptional regulator n=1 Tax=Desulfolucanica intricata TaxID=1285191 RepID=UPI00082F134B|nr:sigma 54-interacting transcriptional regulator [Desulfolucanica intricata]